jgi:hypothetical protein
MGKRFEETFPMVTGRVDFFTSYADGRKVVFLRRWLS